MFIPFELFQVEAAFRNYVHRAIDEHKAHTTGHGGKQLEGDNSLNMTNSSSNSSNSSSSSSVEREREEHSYSDVFVCHGTASQRLSSLHTVWIHLMFRCSAWFCCTEGYPACFNSHAFTPHLLSCTITPYDYPFT